MRNTTSLQAFIEKHNLSPVEIIKQFWQYMKEVMADTRLTSIAA